MNRVARCGAIALSLIWLFPAISSASGYSEYENHRIWRLRLAAGQYATQEAQKLCGWSPSSPVMFSDQFSLDDGVSNERLFLDIQAMIRLDQNARAISDALGDDDRSSLGKAREVDAENLSRLKDIVSRYGFPTIKEVGRNGVDAMLLMVAHADSDLEFQRSVLLKMEDEVAKGELPDVYPVVLKAIRPQIVHGEPIKSSGLPDVSERTYGNPRQCYNHKRKDFFDSYIRSRYSQVIKTVPPDSPVR